MKTPCELVLAFGLLACGGAPKIPIEPDPEQEPPVNLTCKLEAGMKPDVVQARCGAPFSKMYAPGYDDAVVWRYCGKKSDGMWWPCRETYGLVYFRGELLRWGRVYEVVQ